nr:hypothetical protein [uncultured Holophaga sp.]
MTLTEAPRSIHYRRRWAYVLWCVLLLAALGALLAWRRPVPAGEGHVSFGLLIRNAPSGTQADVWCGPASKWRPALGGRGPRVPLRADGSVSLGPLPVHIARRRWVKAYHPETTDLVVVELRSPGGAVRYLEYHLLTDLETGLLGNRRKMTVRFDLPWESLSADPRAPYRLQ